MSSPTWASGTGWGFSRAGSEVEFLAGPGFPGEKPSFELLCYKQVSASGISLFMFCEDYLGDEGIQLIMN